VHLYPFLHVYDPQRRVSTAPRLESLSVERADVDAGRDGTGRDGRSSARRGMDCWWLGRGGGAARVKRGTCRDGRMRVSCDGIRIGSVRLVR
jgi:hypothetical protein